MCIHVCTDAHSCAGACAMHAYVRRGLWSTLGIIPQEQTTLVFDTGFLSGTLDSPSRLGWLINEHKGSTWQGHPRSGIINMSLHDCLFAWVHIFTVAIQVLYWLNHFPSQSSCFYENNLVFARKTFFQVRKLLLCPFFFFLQRHGVNLGPNKVHEGLSVISCFLEHG